MEKKLRIAITGPESTGKSELARALAARLGWAFVPEYARIYLEAHGPAYTQEDIVKIALEQKAMEERMAESSQAPVICDTDMLVCRIWSEFVFGNCPKVLKELDEQSHYDFTLLMDIDLPWEPDPLREHPDKRAELLEIYQNALGKTSRPYTLVSGWGEQRLENALKAIAHLTVSTNK